MPVRNAYSCPKGDRNLVGVFTMPELQAMLPTDPTRTRYLRVLRRFVQPKWSGTGAARRYFLVMPEKWAVESIPDDDFRNGLLAGMVPADEFDFEAHEWTQGEDRDHSVIDNAFGGTEFFDQPGNRWNEPEPAPEVQP